ncbi:MAG: hypothetical protein MRECE_49c012 [Mycoplasmataceae bacterium CE_OT135]|nr:MAG: hypothetical protein MRECE_49c012 [Mycoplasmataceae bacterium CE_OT135]
MARQRECQVCKKQLTSKYWMITGYPRNNYKASRANYCASCCDKISKEPFRSDLFKRQFERGWIKIIEKEVGSKMDDEISEFEDKWEKHSDLGIGITKKDLSNKKAFLNSIQKAHAELEPYLQKPEIVEKAWEKEYNADIDMTFYYLFAKSAREKDYKQKVVQPTIEEILGSKLDEEINTATTGNSPGVPGSADGNFKIDNKLIGYSWVDHEDDCRRLTLSFWDDNKLALQAYLQALAIKEQELTGNTKPIEKDKSPNFNKSYQEKSNSNSSNQPKPTNWTLIIILGLAGAAVITGLVIYFLKKPKSR